MESQLHRTQGPHSYESFNTASSDVHDEYEHGGETKSGMEKVKAKVEKLKTTIKHGHGHRDDTETVNDSAPVRSGLVQPTVMGTPVLAEDLYATHSDIVDPPVRSFAQWEEEEKQGAPPPLSTGIYGTQLSDPFRVGHPGYSPDVNREQLRGSIGTSVGMKDDPSAPNPTTTVAPENRQTEVIGKLTGMEEDPSAPTLTAGLSPANYQTKVTDPTDTGGKEAGITGVLRSFDKMRVSDEPESKSLEYDQHEPTVYTGSHGQFAPEPIENPPPDTVAGDPSSQSSSYAGKITSATSAIAGKAAAAKDMIVSKLGSSGDNKSEMTTDSNKPRTKSSRTTDYAHKVADTLSVTLGPVYEKVAGAGSSVMSKMSGSGQEEDAGSTPVPESKGATVREYLADTFRPGDDDKVLSKTITHALHRGKGNAPPQVVEQTSTYVIDEGERRLQDSGN